MAGGADLARSHRHTGVADGVFWTKSRLLICARLLRNTGRGEPFRPLRRLRTLPAGATLLAEDETRLYSVVDPREQELELGKVQNLRVAAAATDGILLEAGEVFSFWRALGRPSQARGYVLGRELRQGCMIPSIAGGICQLSRALSRVADRAGMEIVERHRHTAAPPEAALDDPADSTVFWNYVDLRFRAPCRMRVGTRLTQNALVVRLDALP
jgi:vancomycin resistance protein YoaR